MRLEICLSLDGVSFKDQTIKAKWYDGNEKFHLISFDSCNIAVIERDAFESDAFILIRSVSILDNQFVIHLHDGCFHSLYRLNKLYICRTQFAKIDSKLLQEIRRSLEIFVYLQHNNDFSLTKMFGNESFPHLKYLDIENSQVEVR